jgi:hypothetical protein
MKTLLLVTWIVLGTGSGNVAHVPHSHSYQVIFSSEKTCEAARSAVLAERERANILATNIRVHVSAICTVQ